MGRTNEQRVKNTKSQVVLADARVRVRSSLAIADAEAFIRNIFTEAERELDHAMAGSAILTIVPRMEVELRVEASEATMTREIGRMLASKLLSAASKSEPAREDIHRKLLAVFSDDDPHELVRAARELSPAPGVPPLLSSATMDPAERITFVGAAERLARDPAADLTRLDFPLACLGRIARSGQLDLLVSHLTEPEAAGVLARAVAELHARLGRSASSGMVEEIAIVPPAVRDRARRALSEAPSAAATGPEAEPSEVRVALAALALAARLGLPALAVLAGHRSTGDGVTVQPAPDCESTAESIQDVQRESLPPLASRTAASLRESPSVPARSPRSDWPGQIRVPEQPPGLSDLQRPAPDETIDLISPHAGLAFLLPVLHDIGLSAALLAVHPEPNLTVHRILRRTVERLAVPAREADPALFILAGLLDAPCDDDRSDDEALWTEAACAALGRAAGGKAASYDQAIDAWSSAVLQEARARLAEVSAHAIDLARDVVSLPGHLRSDDERVEVALRFPRAYGALLRAGMLVDLYAVGWLGGRALRFTFSEES